MKTIQFLLARSPRATGLAIVLAATFACAVSSHAQLLVTNGNFQNLTGLTNLGGGWYGGVPTGWTGVNATYTVLNQSGNYVANLNALTTTSPSFAPLYQAVGTVASTGIISLTFEHIHLISPTGMSAGIFNTNNSSSYGAWTLLALPDPNVITTAGYHTVSTSSSITAGTPIGIAFWQGGGSGGAPGIGNVTVVPEPSTSLLVLGATALGLLVRRRRR